MKPAIVALPTQCLKLVPCDFNVADCLTRSAIFHKLRIFGAKSLYPVTNTHGSATSGLIRMSLSVCLRSGCNDHERIIWHRPLQRQRLLYW